MNKEDYEEIEKGCGRLVDNDYAGTTPLDDYYCSEKELCPECYIKKQTFITENVKRINEAIIKMNFYMKEYGLGDRSNFKRFHYDFDGLKADKIFLEEKK